MTIESWTEEEIRFAIRWWQAESINPRLYPHVRSRIKGLIVQAERALELRLALRGLVHADMDTESEWAEHFSPPVVH